MGKLNVITNPQFEEKLASYPDEIRDKMEFLRFLILETAEELEEVKQIEETLKWGELSFVTKVGSTLRIHWSTKNPEYYGMYFQCTSRLVDTFRLVFNDVFTFKGKRAIKFYKKQKLPVEELKACIKAALQYHKVKHLITLGI